MSILLLLVMLLFDVNDIRWRNRSEGLITECCKGDKGDCDEPVETSSGTVLNIPSPPPTSILLFIINSKALSMTSSIVVHILMIKNASDCRLLDVLRVTAELTSIK